MRQLGTCVPARDVFVLLGLPSTNVHIELVDTHGIEASALARLLRALPLVHDVLTSHCRIERRPKHGIEASAMASKRRCHPGIGASASLRLLRALPLVHDMSHCRWFMICTALGVLLVCHRWNSCPSGLKMVCLARLWKVAPTARRQWQQSGRLPRHQDMVITAIRTRACACWGQS